MSDADRQKWDAIYSQPAPSQVKPNAWLAQHIASLPTGRALDVATGRGRNALFLAQHGFSVDAVDISSVAIDQLCQRAHAEHLQIQAWVQDLIEQPQIVTQYAYQLILLLRFVSPAVLSHLPAMLACGGYLLIEQHLQWPEAVSGPRNQKFRVAPGELQKILIGCEIVAQSEGLVDSPDGGVEALARVLVRKP